jgi:hypothetical protein
MPLLEQLKNLSQPGNPEGVCTEAASITAYVLMTGPRSIDGITEVTLPLSCGETTMNPQLISGGKEKSSELVVSKLPEGVSEIWTWKKENEGAEKEMARKGGEDMLKWLKETAPPGVYVGTMEYPGDEEGEDTHVFNFAKTDEGKVYLIDSSIQNFAKIKGPEDVGMNVIAQEGVDDESEEEEETLEKEENLDEIEVGEVTVDDLKVGEPVNLKEGEQSQKQELSGTPFSKVYCSSNMKLDYCGKLHPECALELQQTLKRSVRQDYSPGEKPTTGQKITVTHN